MVTNASHIVYFRVTQLRVNKLTRDYRVPIAAVGAELGRNPTFAATVLRGICSVKH